MRTQKDCSLKAVLKEKGPCWRAFSQMGLSEASQATLLRRGLQIQLLSEFLHGEGSLGSLR